MNSDRYKEEDFNGFIDELISGNNFNDSKEEGIARLVKDKGFESLSVKQKHVFENAISYYIYDECERCGNDIPWCEMYFASDNGGLCSWCHKMSEGRD